MSNVFVERIDGAIKGVYANFQEGYAEDELDESHPDVVEFRTPKDSAPNNPILKLQVFLAANPDVAALLK